MSDTLKMSTCQIVSWGLLSVAGMAVLVFCTGQVCFFLSPLMGLYHFDQIAGWAEAEIARVDSNLKGRASRDNWVEQAKNLAAGGETEFSRRVAGGDVC